MEVDTSSATTWRVVNIIKEECIKVGNPVEEALICCVLKMIYDNPKNGFDSDLPMDRHAVRRLIGEWFLIGSLIYNLFATSEPPKYSNSNPPNFCFDFFLMILRHKILGALERNIRAIHPTFDQAKNHNKRFGELEF